MRLSRGGKPDYAGAENKNSPSVLSSNTVLSEEVGGVMSATLHHNRNNGNLMETFIRN